MIGLGSDKNTQAKQTHLKRRPSSFRAENVPRGGRAPPPLVPDTDFISDKSGDCAQVLRYNTMQYRYDCTQLVECNTIQIQLPAVATQAIVFGPSLRHISLRAPRTRGPALPPCVCVCVCVCSKYLRNTWQMLICGKPMRFLPIERSQNLPIGKYFANCSQPQELEAWSSVCLWLFFINWISSENYLTICSTWPLKL